MSDFKAFFRRIGEIEISLSEKNPVSAKLTGMPQAPVSFSVYNGGIESSLIPVPFMQDAWLNRIGGITSTLTYTSDVTPVPDYLEIEPEVIWVYPDYESWNNVYSNTTWNIN